MSGRLGLLPTLTLGRVHLHDPLTVNQKSDLHLMFARHGWGSIDGSYNDHDAVLLPDHKKLMVTAVGDAQFIMSVAAAELLEKVAGALSLPSPELVMADAKLRVACEQYAASFFQSGPAPRFITLVTALEAVVTTPDRPEPIRKLLDSFKAEVQGQITAAFGQEVIASYGRLLGGIEALKRESIRTGLVQLVADALKQDPEIEDPERRGAEMKDIYELRNRLLHRGEKDEQRIADVLGKLVDLVPRVLTVLARSAASRQ